MFYHKINKNMVCNITRFESHLKKKIEKNKLLKINFNKFSGHSSFIHEMPVKEIT